MLPHTGNVDLTSLYVPLALAIGAMLVFAGLVMRRQSVRIKWCGNAVPRGPGRDSRQRLGKGCQDAALGAK